MYFKLSIVNKCIIVVFFFCITSFTKAQNKEHRVKQALKEFVVTENPNDGIKNLRSLQDIVGQTSDSLQGHYYLDLGIAYGQLNQADSSFWFLDKAEKIAKQTELDFLLAMVNNTRGLVYMGKAEYESSLTAYQEVMKLAEGKNNTQLNDVLSKTYGNLGGVYHQLGQIDKALEITKKSLALSETIQDTTEIALNHLRLAIVYNDMDQLDNGITHLNKARTFFKNLNNTTMLVYAESNLGMIFKKKNQLDSAFVHYQKANKYAKTLGEQEEYITTFLGMSSIKLAQSKYADAKMYVQNALDIAKKNGFSYSEQKAYDLLYKIALQTNSISQALNYRNDYVRLADSLNNVEVKTRVADLEMQYETTKKEKEIQKLTFESQLKDANLAKARNAQIALVVGGIAIIVVLLVFFITKQKKKKVELIAQVLQVEALQKRFMELHSSPSELAVDLDMKELNQKLHTHLTLREFETLKLCISGKTNIDIAEQLYVTVSTIKFHLRNTYGKLGVNNRKEAFQFMLKSI